MMRRFVLFGAALGGLAVAGASAHVRLSGLAGVKPGLWEVSRTARGDRPARICLRDVGQLASYAHDPARCTRTVLRNQPGTVVMELSCGADFGRSTLTVTTPRSLKLETQGIRRGEPYDQTYYARRVGECRRAVARR
jgi:hypothetical protein